MRGYYRDPARTRAVLDAEGWFRTGDLARLDGDDLVVTGRANDLIIRFGFNVYPGEVEAVLCRHAAVLQAAVAGRPSAEGEEILAFIVPRAGFAPDITELAQHAAQHLTSYKRPTRFFVLHALPLTPTGKIDKRSLLAAAENPAAFVKAA
jgi:acyl-CoA synthetase (AMP-forming)/AMP-acid ligase II